MTIRRISEKEIRRASLGRVAEAPPTGIGTVLRAAWPFARKMAQRFAEELDKEKEAERTEGFLKRLIKRFS